MDSPTVTPPRVAPLTVVPERTMLGRLTGVTLRGATLRAEDLSSSLERFRMAIANCSQHPLSPALHIPEERSVDFRGYPNDDKTSEIIVQAFGRDAHAPSTELLLYELSSKFLDIQDGRLRSTLSVRTVPALRSVSHLLAPLFLGKIVPFTLTRLVIGWQYFKPLGLGARFGFAPFPTVSGTIQIGEQLDYELIFPISNMDEVASGYVGEILQSLDSFTEDSPLTAALRSLKKSPKKYVDEPHFN